MENRLSKKINTHLHTFKQAIQEWFKNNNSDIIGDSNINIFLQFIFDYNYILLTKEDFTRRKRIKNNVLPPVRCCAYRANGEQCTRRKKTTFEFCGTHIKGTPYGIIQQIENETPIVNKYEVWIQEIQGIQYFIDDKNNIYLHEHILNNTNNPNIIGKYTINDAGNYIICGDLT